MDRASRFQNAMPLSSGNFNKPPLIQTDGVGMKPPSLEDRFKNLLKEREEELRVFGGGAVLPLSTDEIVRLYEIVLSELTVNLKPIITELTIIAGQQRAHAEGIADAICARIIEAPVEHKLPSLYLLDSIVKNIGKEYIEHFSARLPEVFCEAYAQVQPNMHRAMRHLFGTWGGEYAVFSLSVLKKIEVQLQLTPSVNGQSSGLSSSGASESPRPTQYIHVNPKYLEGQRPFGHSTIDTFVTEGASSSGRAGPKTSGIHAVKRSLPSAARMAGSSSPYGSVGPISPSLEDFSTDSSPKRVAGPTKLIGREDETSEWRTRNFQGSSNQQLKVSASYNNSSGVDLRGPRALISAYGIDEREKNLNRKHHTAEQLDSLGGADQKVATRTWQNTEEEEFDWEDMTPALADWRQSKDIPPGGRHSFTTNRAASPVTEYRGKVSKAPFSSITNSSIVEDVSHISSGRGSIDKIAGVLPNFIGAKDLTSQIRPSFPRESLMLPHQQQSQSHFNAKGDGKFQNSHIRASFSALPPQMQIRGQFGINNAANTAVDQLHTEQHLGSTRSMSQVALPHIPSLRPGSVPANLQHTAQPSLSQPNLLMAQEVRQYSPSPYSEHIPSNASGPPMNYRYFSPAHGPSGTFPGVSSLPILNAPNASFHVPRANLQPLPRGPFPGTTQALPISSNTNQVSGLINSLMARGLISLPNQDSVGVEFDPDILKVRHESAITALYADLPRQCKTCGLRFKSQEEHSSHMDWHVNKNRTLRNRKAKPSPKWFVNVTMWLSGAETVGAEAVPGFFPAENSAEKEEDEELAVPADEEQNACALCGDPFEDFYSDDLEEWMYKGAVYMYAPTGATVGMDRSQLGPIVHAKCMSDSHAVSSENVKKDEEESTEEGSQRKKLRS